MKEQNASGRTELEDMAGTLQFLLCAVVVTGLWVTSPELCRSKGFRAGGSEPHTAEEELRAWLMVWKPYGDQFQCLLLFWDSTRVFCKP